MTWVATDPVDGVRFFAGLWDRAKPADQEEALESFAFVTVPGGADVGTVHIRQPTMLTVEQGMAGLGVEGPGKAELVSETPTGSYRLAVS